MTGKGLAGVTTGPKQIRDPPRSSLGRVCAGLGGGESVRMVVIASTVII